MDVYSDSHDHTDFLGVANERSTPCLVLLRGAYPQLTDAERRVADYVLAQPNVTLRSSLIQVAQASGAGSGTVTRMCAKLGYSGFAEMKVALAAQFLNPDYDTLSPLRAEDDAATIAQKVMRSGMQSLADTIALLDARELARASDVILQARRIDVYAEGVFSGVIAQHAHARLLLLDLPCALTTVPWQIPVIANQLRSGDVAIAISHSGVTESVVDATRNARDVGAITICLTSHPHSPLVHAAAIHLFAASQDTGEWGHPTVSRLALYGVVEALYAAVLLRKYRDQADMPPSELLDRRSAQPFPPSTRE